MSRPADGRAWVCCPQAKHDGVIAALLALLADMLAALPAPPLPEQQQEALQRLASSITARRMKVHALLSSPS